MPKPGYFDGTEAQVVLEPSSFARELAASARAWVDAKRGGRAAAALTATTTEMATTETTTTPQPPPLLRPPLAEARGRDPRSAQPGGWVRVRIVDSCTASGPEGGLRFCVEIDAAGEEKEKTPKKRWWLPLAWLHPSNPNPVLAVRPLPPNQAEEEEESSWSAGDEAEVKKGGGSGGESWWPATILDVRQDDGGGGGGGGERQSWAQTLVVRIEPCCCYPTGAVVNVSTAATSSSSASSSPSHTVRRKPPLPPLFEEEAARLQLEQERAERSGRMSGGFGSRGGVLGSGRRWSGMATSFGENVHPEEWRRRTAGLLAAEEGGEGDGEEDSGGENGDGGDGEGRKASAAAGAGAAAGPFAGVSSGARTHLIAGFSMEAALCPGQLSTATREGKDEEAEEGDEGEEGENEGDGKKDGQGQPPEQQPKEKKRKTTLGSTRTNRDPFEYDGAARALLEAAGSL